MTRSIVHLFPNFERGGTQRRTVGLLKSLGHDWSHTLVTLDGGRTSPFDMKGGEGFTNWKVFPKEGSLSTVRRLRNFFERSVPDVLLTYSWGAIDGIIANRFSTRVPVIHVEDGFWGDEIARVKRRRVWARRLVLRWADRVVVPSRTLAQIARDGWRVSRERLIRIPNGVDPDRFRPRERSLGRTTLGLPRASVLIGIVGRLDPVKNVSLALETLASVEHCPVPHLVVAGEGEQHDRLERYAQELGLEDRVHFLGHVAEPEKLLSTLDAYLLTSESEQLPYALLEAMATALPVVATAVGDVSQVLPEVQAPYVIVLEGDGVVARLAGALDELLTNPGTRAILGDANRARILEKFTETNTIAHWDRLLRSVLRSPSPACLGGP